MMNEVKDEQLQVRSQRPSPRKRKQHQAEKAETKETSTWWVQIRLFPIWLRIILVTILVVGAIAAGLVIGYGYIGDGVAKDALKWETWQHILDIINGKES